MSGASLVRSAVALGSDLLGLVLPLTCAGCGRGERSLCRTCLAAFGAPYRCEEDTVVLAAQDYAPALGLATWTTASYAGAARHAVLAWKSGARPDLGPVLTAVATRAGQDLGARLSLPQRSASAPADLLVVPAPSGWRRRVSRRLVAADLAAALARGLARGAGAEVWAADVLRRRGGSTHRLGAAARTRGHGAVRVVSALPAGVPVLIVDDVVTTGATIHASRRALVAAGAPVVGAFALAATPPPGRAAIPVLRDGPPPTC
ncbi:ComF family protein [Ruania albidiflava]|uniref:ComF family protein n=1 Tax=Ruania albidiflava TaxID=366586 RepID=UPI0003B430F7|nr:phosphoribosyltransferase family protein [Ruania albidiflava]